MDYRNGDSVEVTGEIVGTINDNGRMLYQVMFDHNVVVAVPEKIMKIKGVLNNQKCVDAKEYQEGHWK